MRTLLLGASLCPILVAIPATGATQTHEAAFGPSDSAVADSLNTLALVRHAQGHPGEAEGLYRRALGIWQTLGPSHARVAVVLNNLAMAHRDQTSWTRPSRSCCAPSRFAR